MTAKKFKFISPGVFLNEIDNSQLPREAAAEGPVIIGRTVSGPAMRPVTVDSFEEFVSIYGEPHPGGDSKDPWRNGNFSAPTYASYAAQAWLKNSSTCTVIRLLGKENANKTTDSGEAGWKTSGSLVNANFSNGVSAGEGGAYGLFVFPATLSGSSPVTATGSLAAVWYVEKGFVGLTGKSVTGATLTGALGQLVAADSSDRFKLSISGSSVSKTVEFSMLESDSKFARKVFNTDPTKTNTALTPSVDAEIYWLGETFENDYSSSLASTNGELPTPLSGSGVNYAGMIVGLGNSAYEHSDRRIQKRDPRTGWIITKDNGVYSEFNAANATKLFRFIALDHGEWAQKNIKISIANIRESSNSIDPYGKFDVLVRRIEDKDKAIVLLERFNGCNLNPESDDYVAKKIGTAYYEFDSTKRRLVEKGDHANRSKFIRVEMNPTVDSAPNSSYLPFGYVGPTRYSDVVYTTTAVDDYSEATSTGILTPFTASVATNKIEMPQDNFAAGSALRFKFPQQSLRSSSAQDGLASNSQAFFGAWFGKTSSSTKLNESVYDFAKPLAAGLESDDPKADTTEVAYYFTLDDIVYNPTTNVYTWSSGSRASNESVTALSGSSYLLKPTGSVESPINAFTIPLTDGSDGVNIKYKDPFGKEALDSGNELTNYAYNTVKEAIDTIRDPEFVMYNLASMPGIVAQGLTSHLLETVESRADALAIIDLSANGFTPAHEGSLGNVKPTVASQPRDVIDTLKDRSLNSSYGATYYPWVQIRDTLKGNSVYVPPSIPAIGAISYTDRVKAPWFAPAGFNRGGLSTGVAGLPVIGVTHKLTSGDRDDLYEANINPIASFPQEGIVIFGQKTLQQTRSALDRINVRRLLLFTKRGISAISKDLIFEPNVQETWDRFIARAEPFLQDIQARFGLTAYKLVLDETTTTPDLIDQNILYAKVFLQPARAIEFIAVDFVITNTGASFED